MKMVIKVVEPEEYTEWIAQQKTFAQSFQPEDDAEGMATENKLSGNEISMIE
jgi:heme/copper-type cytochrome/quinol oxidase subunit 2